MSGAAITATGRAHELSAIEQGRANTEDDAVRGDTARPGGFQSALVKGASGIGILGLLAGAANAAYSLGKTPYGGPEYCSPGKRFVTPDAVGKCLKSSRAEAWGALLGTATAAVATGATIGAGGPLIATGTLGASSFALGTVFVASALRAVKCNEFKEEKLGDTRYIFGDDTYTEIKEQGECRDLPPDLGRAALGLDDPFSTIILDPEEHTKPKDPVCC